MARNILVQSLFQLVLLMILLLAGGGTTTLTRVGTTSDCAITTDLTVGLFGEYGIADGGNSCLDADWKEVTEGDGDFKCICVQRDYTHFTFIFNVFVWCQIFNEFNARRINDDWNVFRGIMRNWLFGGVIIVTIGLQFFIVEVGGDFTKTVHLSLDLWLWSVALGFIALPLGVLMRFIPVAENPRDFAGYGDPRNGLPSSTVVPMPADKRAIVVVPAEEKAVPAAGSGGT